MSDFAANLGAAKKLLFIAGVIVIVALLATATIYATAGQRPGTVNDSGDRSGISKGSMGKEAGKLDRATKRSWAARFDTGGADRKWTRSRGGKKIKRVHDRRDNQNAAKKFDYRVDTDPGLRPMVPHSGASRVTFIAHRAKTYSPTTARTTTINSKTWVMVKGAPGKLQGVDSGHYKKLNRKGVRAGDSGWTATFHRSRQ